MDDEVWEELADDPQLSEAFSELRSEGMPASVARGILEGLPPGGGGGGGPPGPAPVGASVVPWGIAAAALLGVATGGFLLWQSATPTPTSPLESAAPDVLIPPLAQPPEELSPEPTESATVDQPQGLPTLEASAPTSDDALEPAPSVSRRALPSSDLDEVRLLEEARASLQARPRRALGMLRTHARRFPQSQLTQERDVLRIEANLSAGRDERATTLADRFLAQHPHSAQRGRVESLRDRAP